MNAQTRKEFLSRAYNLGFEYEKTYKGCAQCVIAAIHDTLNIRDDSVFRAATGLAAGGGLTGIGVCGGYVGGSMVLSQLCGRDRSDFEDKVRIRHRSFNLTKKLIDVFLETFGTLICRDLQVLRFGRPYYIRDPEEYAKFEEAGAHLDKCTDIVGRAAQITVGIILDEGLVKVERIDHAQSKSPIGPDRE